MSFLSESLAAGHDLVPLKQIPALKSWSTLQFWRARKLGNLPCVRVPGVKTYLSTVAAVNAWLLSMAEKPVPRPMKPAKKVASRLAKHGL